MKIPALIALIFLTVGQSDEEEAGRAPLNSQLFLAAIPVTVAKNAMESNNPQIALEIPRFVGKKFGEISARHKGSYAKDGTISFRGLEYPKSKDKGGKQYKKATFIIDYDEPVFNELAKDIESQFGKKPTPAQLRDYVSKFIVNKNMLRGFDLASKVAQTKEGDCSEHAVLLVALMRRYGYAARTVLGIVLVEARGEFLAVGHAWAEYRHKRKWHLIDAAIESTIEKQDEITVHGYIPVRVQKEEGPGYAAEMINGASLLQIARIVIE